ncbi:HAD-IA family hydrolase [Roseospirillum parvum]|uniref:Haloacid dehalogenase superfamily, subfamily IA, variant 3 with third motif having DD or ED n=1 Tax=Roseospirillum parvum TaxID=83401 RepID=A0A1G8FNU5_9PROT|nr:HAD-IA family hydrolase [Roseospirillum parvum]SDH83795.1 haloacid dehalogenase superfamily, subfamily IA, variant 3 with third motif having DD or ED [Roseospirillum parvum]
MTDRHGLRALLFDLDGTIADTEELHRQAFNDAFEAHHLPHRWSPGLYRRLLRIPGGRERLSHFLDGAEATLSPASRDDLAGRLHAFKTERYRAHIAAGDLAPRPGVVRLMAEARAAGLCVGVVTTSHRHATKAVLKAVVPEVIFSTLITGERVSAKKPHPEAYLKALDQLEMTADQAVAVEDSEPGLAAARAAGLRCVITLNRWTQGGDFAAAGLVADDLDHGPDGQPITLATLATPQRWM